jgi:hypothetical protein
LEGTLTRNGTPFVDQRLSLNLTFGDPNSVSLDFETFELKTDAEGRFTFPKVPPTRLRLQRLDQAQGANASTVFPLETVEIAPGETTIIRLDGRDRTFGLQLRWPAGLYPDPKWHIHLSLQKPIAESPPGPLLATRTRTYFLRPAGDGSYEAKDVLPGEYRVHARALSQQVPGGPARLEAVGDSSVSIPDGESGLIEIGDLQLSRPPQAGN